MAKNKKIKSKIKVSESFKKIEKVKEEPKIIGQLCSRCGTEMTLIETVRPVKQLVEEWKCSHCNAGLTKTI